MNKLPLLLSVPHAGLQIPPEVKELCILTRNDIVKDGDEGAAEIYWHLEENVVAFLSTDIARAIVDLNRAEDDFSKDGVIKTHTCWDVPVYSEFPSDELIRKLINRYHKPYHNNLRHYAKGDAVLAIDCHTMAAEGPPVAPDPGQERPAVCLGDADGSVPPAWRDALLRCFQDAFTPHKVALNEPFSGGYITRTHAKAMPWIQLELSRAPYMGDAEKSECILAALTHWCGLYR